MGQNFLARVINLDKDMDRLARMGGQFENAGISFTRVPAIFGNTPPAYLAAQFKDTPLTAGEIGCYASHLLAMADIEIPTLICEDGITIQDPASFRNTLNAALDHLPAGWDYVHLMTAKKATVPVAQIASGIDLVRHSKIPRGCCAYLISPQGARKFLKPTPRQWTIDDDIKTYWRFDLDIYGLQPGLVKRSKLKSTIDSIQPRGAKFQHFRTLSFDRFTKGIPRNIRNLGFQPWLVCQFKNLVGVR